MDDRPGAAAPVPGDDPAVVDLRAERLLVGTERVARERVRFTKRIVTTTRTIEVPVRIEQLVVEREALTGGPVDRGAPDPDVGDLVVVLHEEVPEVVLRVVPTERVVVRVRTVADEDTVTAQLRTEVADVVVDRD